MKYLILLLGLMSFNCSQSEAINFHCQKTADRRACYTNDKFVDNKENWFDQHNAWCYTRSIVETKGWSKDEIVQVCLVTQEECESDSNRDFTGKRGEPAVKTGCVQVAAREHTDTVMKQE